MPMNAILFPLASSHVNRRRRCPRLFQSAVLIGSSILFLCAGNGQTPEITSPSAPTALTGQEPTASVTFGDGSSLKVRSRGKRCPLIEASPGQPISIQFRFPASSNGSRVVAQALDGGVISQAPPTSSVAADGTASFQFQPARQTGLYRVLVQAGAVVTALQFWVPDAQNPSSNPAALKP